MKGVSRNRIYVEINTMGQNFQLATTQLAELNNFEKKTELNDETLYKQNADIEGLMQKKGFVFSISYYNIHIKIFLYPPCWPSNTTFLLA